MHALQMEAPGTAMAVAAQAQVDSTNHAIVGDRTEQLKAALMASAARAGIGVYESLGGYIVSRGVPREVPDLRALHACLGIMGALK